MIVRDSLKNELKIEITVSGVETLARYQKGLLSLLRKISIEKCDAQFKSDLVAVYDLLSHITIEKEFPEVYEALLTELNSDKN